MTRLINLKGDRGAVEAIRAGHPGYLYIGRQMPRMRLPRSPWANPYRLADYGQDRDTVLRLYEADILGRPDLIARLEELRGKTLACWCHPERCHGDVLIELLEAR